MFDFSKKVLDPLISEAKGTSDDALKMETVPAKIENLLSAKQTAKDMTQPSTVASIGDKMPDGTIYAGISPNTKKPMYTTRADAPLTMTFRQAAEYGAKLVAHGHQDWRVPTLEELDVLFNNRAAIGGFSLAGLQPSDWYWSSSSDDFLCDKWAQRFRDGYQASFFHRVGHMAFRCVR